MMNQAERREFVEKHRTCVFAFQRKQGPPSMSVVYYVMDDDDLLISTMAERAKAKAVARTGEASVCPPSGVGRVSEIGAELLEDLPVLLQSLLANILGEVALQVRRDPVVVDQRVCRRRRGRRRAPYGVAFTLG